MAPRLAEAWSDRAHGTSTLNIATILAQLLITEAGIATAEAHHIKTSLELANLKCEMATLRRMLEAQSSSPQASPSTAAEPPSIAAISANPDPKTVLCRGCKAPLPCPLRTVRQSLARKHQKWHNETPPNMLRLQEEI